MLIIVVHDWTQIHASICKIKGNLHGDLNLITPPPYKNKKKISIWLPIAAWNHIKIKAETLIYLKTKTKILGLKKNREEETNQI